MKCICCNRVGDIADSHVISKFIRNKITGIDTGKGKKYEFQWCGLKGLPRQDLPKPKLLCKTCDNMFGGTIECAAAELLLPHGDASRLEVWKQLSLRTRRMPFDVEGLPFDVVEYQALSDVAANTLRKFSVLTAWRALHAMRSQGAKDATDYLASSDGQRAHDETIQFLEDDFPGADLLFPYYSELYFLGPVRAACISGSNDEVPFAWTFIGDSSQAGVAVLLGFWIIIWSLIPETDPRSDFNELQRLAFTDWMGHVVRALGAAKTPS